MGRKNNKKKYTVSDHIFAITIVIVMLLVILSIPFIFFYSIIYLISLTPDVEIKGSGTIYSIKIIFKFFITMIIITGVVDVIFTQVIKIKSNKNIISFFSETVLMFLIFYLFVMMYTLYNNEIHIRNNGNLYISLFLLVLYIIFNLVYLITKRLYRNMMTNIQNKHNAKKNRW